MKKLEVATIIQDEWAKSPYHDLDEPYRGVGALFNADLHKVEPDWAPREDWLVVAPGVLHRKGHVLKADRYIPIDTPEGCYYTERDERIAEAYDEVERCFRELEFKK
jgi:hypothetical protein